MFLHSIKSISTNQLQQLLKDGIYLIDVREPFEYQAGHIKQAMNVPLSTIHQFNRRKDQTYYVICQSGMRSKKAAKILQKLGYDVVNVSGGMNQWSGNISR